MTVEDYPAVCELWLQTPGMGLNSADDSREGIEKYLERNPTTSFVALLGGKTVGCILAGHDGRRGHIYHTAVHAQHRGKGIGTQLVQHAMAALEKQGIHKVMLVAFADNLQGNAFWEKQGFTLRDDLSYRNKNITPLQAIKPE